MKYKNHYLKDTDRAETLFSVSVTYNGLVRKHPEMRDVLYELRKTAFQAVRRAYTLGEDRVREEERESMETFIVGRIINFLKEI